MKVFLVNAEILYLGKKLKLLCTSDNALVVMKKEVISDPTALDL